MSFSIPFKAVSMAIFGLFAVSSVYAQPIREATQTQEQSTQVLQPRDPVRSPSRQ